MEQVIPTTPSRQVLGTVNTPSSGRVFKQAKRRSVVATPGIVPAPKTPLRGLRFHSSDTPQKIYQDENHLPASPEEKLVKAQKDLQEKEQLILRLQQQLAHLTLDSPALLQGKPAAQLQEKSAQLQEKSAAQLHMSSPGGEDNKPSPLATAEGTAASMEEVTAEEKSHNSCVPDIPAITVSPCHHQGKEPGGYGFEPRADDTDETMNLVNMPSVFVPGYPGDEVNKYEEEEDTMQILGEASAFVRETLGDPTPPADGMGASDEASVSTTDCTKPEAARGGQDGFSTSVGRYVDGVISQAVTNVLEDQFKTFGELSEDESQSEDELAGSSPCRNLRDIATELQADLSYSSPLLRATDMTVSKMGESRTSTANKAPSSPEACTAGVSTVNDEAVSAEAPPSPVAGTAGDSTLSDEAVGAAAPPSPVAGTAGDEAVDAFVDDIISSAADQLQASPCGAPWGNLRGIAAQLQADLSFSSPAQPTARPRENAPDSEPGRRGMEVVATSDAHSVIDRAFRFLHEQDHQVTEETVTMATADGQEQHITIETASMATTDAEAAPTATVSKDTGSSPLPTPKKFADSATATSPVATVVRETEMTPKSHVSVATATTPARVVARAVGTSPLATVTKETEMTPTKFCDVAAGTTPPPALVAMAIGTTPVRQVAMETMMTPVRVTEEGTATTPGLVPHVTTGTAMTPGEPDKPEDSQTVDLSALDEAGLRRRAQALSISNELLRNDISALNEDRVKLSQSVHTLKQRLENSDADLRAEVARLTAEKAAAAAELQKSADRLQETEQRLQDSQLLVQNMSRTMQQGEDSLKTQEEQAALIGQLQRKNNQLEEDLLRSYQQHKEELTRVTHERDRYWRHLEQSQVEMMQLEEDLQVYINLFQEMEETKVSNDDNTKLSKECTEHLQNIVGNVEKDQESLLQERGELERLRVDCDQRTKELDDREQTMLAENQRLKFEAEDATRKESQTNEDLFSAMSQVSDLSADVALLTVAEEETRLKLQEAASRCEALQREAEERGAELVGLQATLSLQEMENETLQDRLKESESKLSKMNEQLDAEFERFGMEMETTSNDLQTANQEREQLRHDLENCLSIMEENERVAKQQKQELEQKEALQAELYRCREQLEASEAQYHEQLAFHEAERDTQSESLRETEEALLRETQKAEKFQKECEERQEALVSLQGNVKELKTKLSETLQELDSIKTSAHHMLLQQGQEMQATREELGAVRGRLEGLASSLQARIGNGEKAEQTPAVALATPAKSAPGSSSMVTPARAVSLVSSIMYAVREKVIGTPSPRPDKGNAASTGEQGTRDTIDLSESTSDEEPGEEKTPDQSEQSLVAQTEAVSDLVTRVLGMMKMLEKASDLALSDLQKENMTLKRKLGRIHQDHDDTIHDVTSDLIQSEQREEKLRVELNLKREELAAVQTALEYSKDKLSQLSENMGSLSDAQATCKKQTAELEKLRVRLRSHEEKNRILQEELESALGQRSHHGDTGGSEVTLVRERIALKAEVQDLRLKVMDKEEEMTQVLATANRRMKTHEANQEKAETEVCRLDNMIEAIRKTLLKNKDIVRTCDDLAELLRDLDGNGNSEETIHFV
ncbi:putative leucine-rich repeat-containing protein DDB_G0290503 isoform X2 [Branchiostoma lanceolatum]|uniref:putative leucine-rich repeat-containing protein DDB_G0290503 isoform X1 n=1 Tax=Branchiostoma lanceolatum TaxID=7740 RepID=UPI003452E60E